MSATVEPVARTDSDTASPRRETSGPSPEPDGASRMRGLAMRRAQRTRAAAAQTHTDAFMRDQTATAAIDGRVRVERGPGGAHHVVPAPSAIASVEAQRRAARPQEAPRAEAAMPSAPAARPAVAARSAVPRPVAAPAPVPARARTEPRIAPAPPRAAPPEPVAFSEPAAEPSDSQFEAELATGRTTNDRRALAAQMLERFRADAERVGDSVAADGERQKSDVEARADAGAASIRRTAATRTRAIRTAFAAAKSRIRAHGEQHKAAIVRGAAEARRNAQHQTTAESNITDAELTRRRTELQTFMRNERAQPRAIVDTEAERARRELRAAAMEARRVGEAEAVLHPDGSNEYAADQRAAARRLAREAATDIIEKIMPVRDELRERAEAHGSRYDGFGDGVMRQLDGARPILRSALRDVLDSSIASVADGQPAAIEAIDRRVAADVAALTGVESQAAAFIDAAADAAAGEVRRVAAETTAAIEAATAESVAGIERRTAAIASAIDAEPDPVVDDVRDLTTSVVAELRVLATERRAAMTAAVSNATRQIVAAETRLQTMAAETQTAAVQRATIAVNGVAGAMQSAADARAAHGRAVIDSITTRQRAIRTDALRQIDADITRVHGAMREVTAEFRTTATQVTDDAVSEGCKPLTDPLWERVRDVTAGILAGLGELLKGFAILVGIAALIFLFTPLGFAAALLVAGIGLLAYGLGSSIYQRHLQDPGASVLTLLGRGVMDVTGAMGIAEAWTGRDWVTDAPLSDYERARRGTVGGGSAVMLLAGARGVVRSGGFRPPGGWVKNYPALFERAGTPEAPIPTTWTGRVGTNFRLMREAVGRMAPAFGRLRGLRFGSIFTQVRAFGRDLRGGAREAFRDLTATENPGTAEPHRRPTPPRTPPPVDGEGFPIVDELVARHGNDHHAVIDEFLENSPRHAESIGYARERVGAEQTIREIREIQNNPAAHARVGGLDGLFAEWQRVNFAQRNADAANQFARSRGAATPADAGNAAASALQKFLNETGPRQGAQVGDGSDAAAILNEAATRQPTAGKFHAEEASGWIANALEHIAFLRNLRRVHEPTRVHDPVIEQAQARVEQLQNVLETVWNRRQQLYPHLWNAAADLAHPRQFPPTFDPRRATPPSTGPPSIDSEGFPLIDEMLRIEAGDQGAALQAFARYSPPRRALTILIARMRFGVNGTIAGIRGVQNRPAGSGGRTLNDLFDAWDRTTLAPERAAAAETLAQQRATGTQTNGRYTPEGTRIAAETVLSDFVEGTIRGNAAAVIRNEAATGNRTGSRWRADEISEQIARAQENLDYLRDLRRVHETPPATQAAMDAAQARIAELQRVLETAWNTRAQLFPNVWNPNGSLRTIAPILPPPVDRRERERQPPVQRRIVQRHCACGGTCGPCASAALDENRRVVQMSASGDFASDGAVLPGGSGEPMTEPLRVAMESRFGSDFRGVRIHADGAAAAAAGAMHAEAFTSGRDVYFAAGRYAPQSEDGQRLLAHELAHVVQQSGGAAPGRVAGQLGDGAIVGAHDDPLEREADRSADAVLRGETAPTATSDPSRRVRRNVLDDIGGAVVSSAQYVGGHIVEGAQYVGGQIAEGAEAVADWAISQIDELAPGLRQFLSDPVGLIQERIESAMGGLFGGLYTRISREGLLGTLEGMASEAIAGLAGGAAEMGTAACGAIAGMLQSLFDVARAIAGPAFATVRSIFSAVGGFFSGLWTKYLGPAWDAIKSFAAGAWTWIEEKARWVWDLIAPIRNGMARLWNWVKRQFNVAWSNGSGVLDWLKGLAARAWDWVKEKLAPIMGPLRMVAGVLIALSPIGPIVAIIAAAPHVWRAIRWLVTNWGPDMLVRARRVLSEEIFPLLQSGLETVGGLLSRAAAWLGEQLGSLVSGLGELAEALGVHSFLGAARDAIVWAADQVRAFVEWAGTKFIEFVETARAVLAGIWRFLRPAVIVLVKLSIAATNPFLLTLVLASWGWMLLPDCFKPPIVAFLLDALIGAVNAIPELRSFGETWARVRALILEHLRAARRASVEKQIEVSNKVASVIGGPEIDAYGNLFSAARQSIPILPGAFQEELIGMDLTQPLPMERREEPAAPAQMARMAVAESGTDAHPDDALLARPLRSSDFEVSHVSDLDPEFVTTLGMSEDDDITFGENAAAPSNEDVQQQLAEPEPETLAAGEPQDQIEGHTGEPGAVEPARMQEQEPRTPEQQIDDLLAAEAEQNEGCETQQAPPSPQQSASAVPEAARQYGPFTPMQRARYLMGKMTAAISRWYECHRTAILAGVITALVVIIVAAIFTGGAVLEAVPAILEVLGTIMIGVAIVNIAAKVAEYIGKSILGDVPGAASALAHGLAAGAIELIFAIVFAGAAAAAQRLRALVSSSVHALAQTRTVLGAAARGTLRFARRGQQLARQGRQLLREVGQATRQFFIRQGKVVIRGLARGFSRGLRSLDDLARRLWDMMPFRRYRITLQNRRLTLWGSRSPWIKLAELLIKAQEAIDAQTEAARMGNLANNPFPGQSIAVNRNRAAMPVYSQRSMPQAQSFVRGEGHVYVPGDIGAARGFQTAEQLGLRAELPVIPGLSRTQPMPPQIPHVSDVRPWHSEIQMAMTRGGTQHGIGSSLHMCSRCRQFFPPYARALQTEIVVADPEWVWFFMRGRTVRIPRTTFDPMRARIMARINNPAAVDTELRDLARMLFIRLPPP